MDKKLTEIVTASSGIFAQPNPIGGVVVYLLARNFDTSGDLIEELMPELQITKNIEKHLLRAGDILFCAKGARNFATVIKPNMPPAVASTSFLILRILPSSQAELLPEYLAWWLNLPITKSKLSARAQGTSITTIDKAAIDELYIKIPDIQKQQAIVQVALLTKRAKQINAQLETLKEQHTQLTILNALTTND